MLNKYAATRGFFFEMVVEPGRYLITRPAKNFFGDSLPTCCEYSKHFDDVGRELILETEPNFWIGPILTTHSHQVDGKQGCRWELQRSKNG